MFGAPDSPPGYCVGHGRTVVEWMERRELKPVPPRFDECIVVVCPPCWHAGWRLVGSNVVEGKFWGRRWAAHDAA